MHVQVGIPLPSYMLFMCYLCYFYLRISFESSCSLVSLQRLSSCLFIFRTSQLSNGYRISVSSDAEKAKRDLWECRNNLEEKNHYKTDHTQVIYHTRGYGPIKNQNIVLLKQTYIFCNTATKLYAKLTFIYHSSEQYKKQN